MATPTKAKHTITPQTAPQLSKNELDRITEVFKIYETGLREATIYPKVNKKNSRDRPALVHFKGPWEIFPTL